VVAIMPSPALSQDHWPAAITAAIVDKILVFLAPLFLGAMVDDIATARQVASTTLASYGAQTDPELRLVALIIAFSFGALDALGRAANPDLPMNQVLRLRGNANALNRAAQQNENRLDKLRRQPVGSARLAADQSAPQPADPEPADDLPVSSDTADLIVFARSALKAAAPSATPVATPTAPSAATVVPMSRQQRRAAERQAEKIRLRRQEVARLAERATARMAASVRTAARTA
jgi:hypothetical protein